MLTVCVRLNAQSLGQTASLPRESVDSVARMVAIRTNCCCRGCSHLEMVWVFTNVCRPRPRRHMYVLLKLNDVYTSNLIPSFFSVPFPT